MNWKLVSLGGAGLLTILGTMINWAAEEHYHKVAKEKAIDDVGKATKIKIAQAQEVLDIADEVEKRERKEVFDRVKAWKRQNNYDGRIRDIHSSVKEELNDFKNSINYFDRKQDIEDAYEDAIEAYKESIDYDYELSLYETAIEDAKDLYKRRCKRIDAASGSDSDISEALNDVKKSEKEKMDEAVSAAKNSIADLKSKLRSEENKLNRKKQSQLRELENELQAVKTRLNKSENDACGQIEADMRKAEEEIRADVLNKRSEIEISAIDRCDECVKLIDEQKDIEDKNAWLIYENTPASEKWAAYLKSEGVPKWLVVFAGALPLIPVGFGISKYVTFVYRVVRAM